MPKQLQKKLTYTRSRGRIIARAAKKVRAGRFHIISSVKNNGWCLVSDGALKPMRVFSTKGAAVSFIKKYQGRSARPVIDIIVHRKDGGVENKISL